MAVPGLVLAAVERKHQGSVAEMDCSLETRSAVVVQTQFPVETVVPAVAAVVVAGLERRHSQAMGYQYSLVLTAGQAVLVIEGLAGAAVDWLGWP